MLFFIALSAHAQNTGSIRGVVFEDVDGDKIQNDDEPGIPAKFVITSPATGHIEVATNENGAFTLSGLPEGTYTVVPPHINGYALYGGETGFVTNYNVLPNKQTLIALPYQHYCAEFVIKEVKCNVSPTGVFSGYTVTFDYTNVGTFPVKKLVFTPPAGVTVQWGTALSNTIPFISAVNVGDTVTRTVTITGATPGFKCIAGSQHNATGSTCCNISLCLRFPTCDCFQITNQTFQINSDESVLWCFTIQNLSNQPSKGVKFNLPAGVTMTPNPLTLSSASGLLLPFQTTTACVTVSGMALGAPLCFETVLSQDSFEIEVCKKQLCINIPPPNLCVGTGQCTKYMPVYYTTGTTTVLPEWQANIRSLGNTVAAMTCWSPPTSLGGNPAVDPVFAMINLDRYQCGSFIKGRNWTAQSTPLQRNNYHAYHGKPDVGGSKYNWTRQNLGTVFGVEIDTRGNCYLAHSSASHGEVAHNSTWIESDEAMGSAGATNTPGDVYVIQNGSGLITKFVGLPFGASKAFPPFSPAFAGLGNIAYDSLHDQFFVTNHFDFSVTTYATAYGQKEVYNGGRIYRVTTSGNGALGTISTVNNGTQMYLDGKQRMSSSGTQFWGIAVHRDRLYVSRWLADKRNLNYDGLVWQHNQIWSAPIEPSGDVLESKFRLELEVPFLSGHTYSNPVADVEFDDQGIMYLAERSMMGLADRGMPHDARVLAFICDPTSGQWIQQARLDANGMFQSETCFQVGRSVVPFSACGGVAADFNRCNAHVGGYRLWATGDQIGDFDGSATTPKDYVYGLTGLPFIGGQSEFEILISGTNSSDQWKNLYNEVDIPCYQSAKGTLLVQLQGIDFSGGISFPGWVEVRDPETNELIDKWSGNIGAATQFDIRGNFPPKNYDIVIKVSHWLARRVKSIYMESGLNGEVSASLLNGDCNGDNYVGTDDYLVISDSFDKNLGETGFDPRADLNNDGTVNTDDYLILNETFDTYGDL